MITLVKYKLRLDFLRSPCYGAVMLKESEDPKKFFYVVCANWESAVQATDAEEAAALSLEEASQEYGKNLCLSPTISVIDLAKCHDKMDMTDSVYFLYTPTVLANAGMHSLSKKYSNVINILKK